MSLLNYSVTLVAKSPENVNDIRTMFDEVRAVVNNLDNDNIAPDAGIDYSKLNVPGDTIPLGDLEYGSPGQIPIAGAAPGALALRTVTGEMIVSATGDVTLRPEWHLQTQTAAKDLVVAGIVPGMQTPALSAGWHLCWVTLEVEQGSGADTRGAQFQLEKNAGETGIKLFKISADNDRTGFGGTMAICTSDGNDFARVTFTGPSASLTAVAVRGTLATLKVV